MKPQEMLTLGIAVAGFLLSLRNTWRDYRRDKIRLRVIPKVCYPVGPIPDSRPCFAFEIINEGVFPVTVDDVGFLFVGTKHRGAITAPILHDKGEWPRRLEPHSAVTVYSAPVERAGFELRKIKCAYATTASGKVFRGRSKALRTVVKQGRVPEPRRSIARSGMPGMLIVSDFNE